MPWDEPNKDAGRDDEPQPPRRHNTAMRNAARLQQVIHLEETALYKCLRTGFYGRATIEIDVEDGVIVKISDTLTQKHKPESK